MDLLGHLASHRALRVASRSPLFPAVRAGVRTGRLVRILPAVFCLAGQEDRPDVRAAAICAADDTAVLTGAAALAVADPDAAWPERITFNSRRRWKSAPAWAIARRSTVPADLVVRQPLPHVSREVALLQVAAIAGSGMVDDALRRWEVAPARLDDAVAATSRSWGNRRRRRIARGSRQRPWSVAERDLHDLLARAGITGWCGNLGIRVGRRKYFLDVAFPDLRIAVEVDGHTHHGDAEAFERDRRRRNELVLAGWLVLNVTPTMLREEPKVVVAWVRKALALREAA